MKNLIKVIIIVGVAVALFGTATVKKWASLGVDKGVDAIGVGVDKIESSGALKQIGDSASSNWNNAVSKFFSTYAG